MPPRHRVRSLTLALVAGTLVLAGCDGEEGGDAGQTTEPAPTTATADLDDDGDIDGDDDDLAEQTAAAAPVAPPTEPMQVELAPGERSASQDGDTITVEGDRAAFVLPSGNIACVLTDETATCQAFDKTYTPGTEELASDVLGECSAETADAMRLVDESAPWTCVAEDLISDAAVEAGGWWTPEVEGETLDVDDLVVGVLPYGQTLSVGPVSCASAEDGVTCANPDLNGRRFVLSSTRYAYDRNG